MRRDWSQANDKREREGCCRVGRKSGDTSGCSGPVEMAHTVGRRYDRLGPNGVVVNGDEVVPLCTAHHAAFDAHRLDLLPYLTMEEQAAAVRLIGLERALMRLVPSVKIGGGADEARTPPSPTPAGEPTPPRRRKA